MTRYVTPEKWAKVNPDNKKLLENYLFQLKVDRKPQTTIETYVGNIKRFFVYILDNLDNRSALELTKLEFQMYCLYIGERVSTASHNHYLSSVKCLMEFAEDADHVEYKQNVCRKLKGTKIERVREIIFLDDDQVTRLYEELLRREDYQMAAYLALSYDSTARRAEIMQVEKKGFSDPSRRNTNYVHKKGDPVKSPLFYDRRTVQAVGLWLKQRGEDNNPSLWAAFGGRQRKKGSPNSWCNRMSKILSEIEGEKIHFTPHSLRHSAINNMEDGTFYACEVRRIPRKQRVIQTFANHATWAMTESYCKNKKYQSVTEELGIEIIV